jgi:hypothetical protein
MGVVSVPLTATIERRPVKVATASEGAGLCSGNWLHVEVPGAVNERPPRPAWITDALLAETIDVWTEAYESPVSEADAIDILVNVGRLAEALLDTKQEMHR